MHYITYLFSLYGYTISFRSCAVVFVNSINSNWLVSCIEDLRRFKRYFSHIMTWKQEITNL